jgi:hypothetical protein
MLTGYRNVSDGMRDIADDKATDSDVSRALGEGPAPGQERLWAIGAMMKTSKLLELRYQVVTYSLMEVALGYVLILLGVANLCLTILRWNRGERDALICKLLRAKLQELEQVAAPNSRRAGQLPASPEAQSSDSQRASSSGGGG